MKSKTLIVFIFIFCYVECRKTYAPIDKNANLAFINMEGGGVKPNQGQKTPVLPQVPAQPQTPSPVQPKPVAPTPSPVQTVKPTPAPVKPQTPSQIKPIPVNPTPVVKVTTPGPGSVKQLVNFYDSQGKASVIRPYSYSQAVKQG